METANEEATATEAIGVTATDDVILEEVTGATEAAITGGFFTNKYFLVTVLAAIAGIAYGLTYISKNIQVNFTLYCCSVWFVCLALIFLANYTESSPPNPPT